MDNFTLVKENWPKILEKIRVDHDLTNISYTSWLEPLEIRSVDNQSISFVVPSGIMGINVLNKKYTLAIKVAIAEITGLSLDIHYMTPDQQNPVKNQEEDSLASVMENAHLNPKYTFDTFVVGGNNKFAHAASLAVAESPGEIYNPLYLYAGVGLGKTHLMHSIAHFILKNNPKARVLYVTSEDFTNELIDSIRNGNNSAMSKFRDKYRTIDVLLIDDIQFIIGKESTQEEFFHTFEALYQAKKQIIISSDKPPKDLDILEERIRSRLEMGLIADIAPPDYETRMAILRKKEDLDGYHIDDAVLDYIAKNIKSNIRELEGCLNRIRAKSILEKRTISLELAEEILKDIISPDEKRSVTSEMIIDAVAEHFHLTSSEIRSQKRDTKFVYPRKIAMYLCREMTEDSLLTIANLLNKKDHTTVISAYRKIEKELQTSEETRNNVETIKKKINPNI
ncbi:MAG TPA: chromosomal replication initiator protein DnaA [Lachnospiraceae bacterium]|nr:chromosomal replication initiator protein DnaA [Lachnospiraceae bacterium]